MKFIISERERLSTTAAGALERTFVTWLMSLYKHGQHGKFCQWKTSHLLEISVLCKAQLFFLEV